MSLKHVLLFSKDSMKCIPSSKFHVPSKSRTLFSWSSVSFETKASTSCAGHSFQSSFARFCAETRSSRTTFHCKLWRSLSPNSVGVWLGTQGAVEWMGLWLPRSFSAALFAKTAVRDGERTRTGVGREWRAASWRSMVEWLDALVWRCMVALLSRWPRDCCWEHDQL
jgi:hypothetical protein